MSDLLAEVDEMMRQERLEKLWKEHGGMLIGFVVAVILMTAAISGYRSWTTHVKTEQTSRLMTLMESSDFPENISAEEIQLRGGLKGMALITAGGAYVSDGKTDEALKVYQAAAEDKSISEEIRQLAVLMAVRLQSGNQDYDAQSLLDLLKPVVNDDASPWQNHARLETASLLANREQNYAEAREFLNLIMEQQNIPETLYNSARALDHVYTLKAKTQKNETDQKS